MRLWDHVDAVLDSTDIAPGVEAFVDALEKRSAYRELYEALEAVRRVLRNTPLWLADGGDEFVGNIIDSALAHARGEK